MESSPTLLQNVLIPVVKAVVIINVMAIMSGILTIVERRALAFLQVRKGPNRVGTGKNSRRALESQNYI